MPAWERDRPFQIRLVFCLSQLGDSVEPILGSTSVVETALLFFRSIMNLSFWCWPSCTFKSEEGQNLAHLVQH